MSDKKITLLLTAKNMTAKAFNAVGQSIKSLVAAAAGLGVIGGAAIAIGKKMVDAYNVQAAAEGKLAGVLRATGYATGVTVSQMKKYASELQKTTGVGDETTLSMMGVLASFKGIDNPNTFKRATAALLDMGAALGKAGKGSADVEASSIQVGKALNDPIAGMSALSRVGIVFTDQQKNTIRTLQESGDMMGAQSIILKELESEFGGTAEEVAKAQHGILQLKAAFGDTKEEIGRAIVETDGFDGVIQAVTDSLQRLAEDGYIDLWAQNVRKAIGFVMPLVEGVAKAFSVVKDAVAQSAAALGALSGGATLKEAEEASWRVPMELRLEQNETLLRIKYRKEAEAKIKAEKEAKEMAAVKKQAAAENTPEKAAAKKEAEESRKMEELNAKFAEAAEKKKWADIIATKKEQSKLEIDIAKAKEEKIAEDAMNVRKKEVADSIKLKEAEIAEMQRLAVKRVADITAEAKASKDFEKEQEDDQKKAARLKQLGSGIGTHLSKKDLQFIKDADAIAAAKKNLPQAKADLAALQKAQAAMLTIPKKLDDMILAQAKLDKQMIALMTGG